MPCCPNVMVGFADLSFLNRIELLEKEKQNLHTQKEKKSIVG